MEVSWSKSVKLEEVTIRQILPVMKDGPSEEVRRAADSCNGLQAARGGWSLVTHSPYYLSGSIQI
jgi:hypothetical protein